MAAVTKRKNIRVEIEPDGSWIPSSKTPREVEDILIQRARDIAKQVNRHLDDTGSVGLNFDTIVECEFCENEWTDSQTTKAKATPGEPEGMPICCDEAQEEFWRENIALWPEAQKHLPWTSYSPGWPWEVAK